MKTMLYIKYSLSMITPLIPTLTYTYLRLYLVVAIMHLVRLISITSLSTDLIVQNLYIPQTTNYAYSGLMIIDLQP